MTTEIDDPPDLRALSGIGLKRPKLRYGAPFSTNLLHPLVQNLPQGNIERNPLCEIKVEPSIGRHMIPDQGCTKLSNPQFSFFCIHLGSLNTF